MWPITLGNLTDDCHQVAYNFKYKAPKEAAFFTVISTGEIECNGYVIRS